MADGYDRKVASYAKRVMPMREYGYSIDLPHSADRIWTLMQDYDKWPEFAKPMVTGIEIANKGDADGNGLVRRVNYRLPLGFKGTIGKIKLEPIGENNTRLLFEEKLKLKPPFSWFEGRLQKFMEKYNRKTMQNMGHWLTEHPEYGLDSD